MGGVNGWTKIESAQFQSALATARVQGMKLRAQSDPPTAAKGGFPWPHRTCAEWTVTPSGKFIPRELTLLERKREAKRGSNKLRDAIRAVAR